MFFLLKQKKWNVNLIVKKLWTDLFHVLNHGSRAFKLKEFNCQSTFHSNQIYETSKRRENGLDIIVNSDVSNDHFVV